MTPELIATSGFMTKLTKIHSRGLLNLIAIDEVWSNMVYLLLTSIHMWTFEVSQKVSDFVYKFTLI